MFVKGKTFKIGDAVRWLGNPKKTPILAEGIVKALPESGTRYAIHITKAIDPSLKAAAYTVEADKLELLVPPPEPPTPNYVLVHPK